MSIENFDAIVDAAVLAVEEAETMHDGFWDKEMEGRKGTRPTFQAPSWDLATARKYAVRYFEVAPGEYRDYLRQQVDAALEPGPNDAHVGIPRWV